MSEFTFMLIFALVGGLCIGSFLNVVIHRLPKMLDQRWRADCAEMSGQPEPASPRYNLVVPRSACPACDHPISAMENIPVVSWLVLGGKCRACKAAISPRYPIVELLGATLAVGAVLRFGATPAAVAAAGLLFSLLALTFIDFDTQLLPDDLTLPLLWAGLIVNLRGMFVPLESAVIGAGDFKLLAALGAWLGWQMLPLIILLSSAVGAAIGIGLLVFKGRDHNIPIAFGPYLAIAGGCALFAGSSLLHLLMP
jgi:leader peptidase (prepilin peptidase)/N-methyltransferase